MSKIDSLLPPIDLPLDILETIASYYADIYHEMHHNHHILTISPVFTNAMRRNAFACLTVDCRASGGAAGIMLGLEEFFELMDSSAQMDGLLPILQMVKAVDLTLVSSAPYVGDPVMIELLEMVARGDFLISRFTLHLATASNRPFNNLPQTFQQHVIDILRARHIRHVDLGYLAGLPMAALFSPYLEVIELTAVTFSGESSGPSEYSSRNAEPCLRSLSLRRTNIPFTLPIWGSRNGLDFYRKLRCLYLDESDVSHLQGILDQNDGSLSSFSLRIKGPISRDNKSLDTPASLDFSRLHRLASIHYEMNWEVNKMTEEHMQRSHQAFLGFLEHLLSGPLSRTATPHSRRGAGTGALPLTRITITGFIAPSAVLLRTEHPAYSYSSDDFWDKLDLIFHDTTPTRRRFANLKSIHVFVTHFIKSMELARQADDPGVELLDHTPTIARFPDPLLTLSGQIVFAS